MTRVPSPTHRVEQKMSQRSYPVSRVELRLTRGALVASEPLVTLRPRGTLLMTAQSFAE